MKLIKTRAEWFRNWDDAFMIGMLIAAGVTMVLVVPALIWHEHFYQDASVDRYDEAAALAEEFPELKLDLSRLREDGILTKSEINGVRAKAKRLRKARATRKFSEQ